MKQSGCSADAGSTDAEGTRQTMDRLSMWAAIIMSLSIATGTSVLTFTDIYSTNRDMSLLQLFLLSNTIAVSISLAVLIFTCVLHMKNESQIKERGAIRILLLFCFACFLAGLFVLVNSNSHFRSVLYGDYK